MNFMEEIMQIGLISKRKHHFVLIDVSILEVDFVSNSYRMALSLRNMLIKCAKWSENFDFQVCA
jgi:hypothetical protein